PARQRRLQETWAHLVANHSAETPVQRKNAPQTHRHTTHKCNAAHTFFFGAASHSASISSLKLGICSLVCACACWGSPSRHSCGCCIGWNGLSALAILRPSHLSMLIALCFTRK